MLYASFVKPTGIYDSFFNKIVARVTRGPFCHSEFVFRWTQAELKQVLQRVKGFASIRTHMRRNKGADISVYTLWGDRVRFRVLNGFSEFWSVPEENLVHIDVPWEQELNAITWLSQQMGAPYDKTGAVLSFYPWRTHAHAYDRYFCSQLMVCALQRLGKIKHANPGAVTPNKLFLLLQETRPE